MLAVTPQYPLRGYKAHGGRKYRCVWDFSAGGILGYLVKRTNVDSRLMLPLGLDPCKLSLPTSPAAAQAWARWYGIAQDTPAVSACCEALRWCVDRMTQPWTPQPEVSVGLRPLLRELDGTGGIPMFSSRREAFLTFFGPNDPAQSPTSGADCCRQATAEGGGLSPADGDARTPSAFPGPSEMRLTQGGPRYAPCPSAPHPTPRWIPSSSCGPAWALGG